MLKHNYSREEIKEIQEHYHKVLEIKKQFEQITLDEDEVISNFLSGNFEAGSLTDPLLDCFGTAVFQYKFNNVVPKRINIMNNTTINNLPHIVQDAEVIPQDIPAKKEATVISCDFCTVTYDCKPSAKKQGKAIVFGSWNRNGEQFDFKYVTAIENASDKILEAKFGELAKLLNMLSHFNIEMEAVEDAKNTFNVTFTPAEVDTCGQYFEIEAVEQQVNILNAESIRECLVAINNATAEYAEMIEALSDTTKTFREITIIDKKNKKDNITYISDSSPEVIGPLVKLVGNITNETTWTNASDVKNVIEHVITEDDMNDMYSVIYSDSDSESSEESVEDEEQESEE